MKKSLHRILTMLILLVMSVSLLINFGIQIRNAQDSMERSSQELFWQINQLFDQSQAELSKVKDEFANTCLLRAEAAAYILQYHPSVLESQEEMEKIAQMLQVDEFHVFDAEGTLFAGSEPKYFGFTFHSGEQMEFFLPMLTDHSLKLCQDITPNTAEGKLMQYAAVWMENGKYIVQIGMEPQRVLEATEMKEPSYIFSLLTSDSGAILYDIDSETYEILGSTQKDLIGKKMTDLGLSPSQLLTDRDGFSATVSGVPSYCYLSHQDGMILGRTIANATLYHPVYLSTVSLLVYLAVVALIMIVSITYYTDKKVVDSIETINRKLQSITAGNLDERIDVHTSPEFTEFSGHINQMVKSLLSTNDMLTHVLNTVKTPIGIYEYSKERKKFLVTGRIPEILSLTDDEKARLLSDPDLFEEKLEAVCRTPLENGKNIYRIDGPKFVRIESFIYGESTVGILTDVTNEILEKEQIKRERDEDQLTGLLNRRAFYAQAEEVFADKGALGYACVFMFDADRLKEVNDFFGHDAGDLYLYQIANLLRAASSPNWKLARIGGDEFAVLIYGCATPDERQKQIAIFRDYQQNSTFQIEPGLILPLAFSAGCACYPEDGESCQALISCADKRMYEEKHIHKQCQNALSAFMTDEQA